MTTSKRAKRFQFTGQPLMSTGGGPMLWRCSTQASYITPNSARLNVWSSIIHSPSHTSFRTSLEHKRRRSLLRSQISCYHLTFRRVEELSVQPNSHPLAPAFAKKVAVNGDKFGNNLANESRQDRRLADDPVRSAEPNCVSLIHTT